MYIAMNRFRVTKGSETAFEHVCFPGIRISTRCRVSLSSICSKVPKPRITRFMPLTPYGRTVVPSKHGRNPRRSGPLIIELATTNRFISDTRNSRGSKFARPCNTARPKQRDRHHDL